MLGLGFARRMTYTKAALLVFGVGLICGFVVVVGEFAAWERAASALMALGLVMIPLGLFADGRGLAVLGWLAARLRRRRPGRRARSSRKPAPRRTTAARKPSGRAAARAPRPRR